MVAAAEVVAGLLFMDPTTERLNNQRTIKLTQANQWYGAA